MVHSYMKFTPSFLCGNKLENSGMVQNKGNTWNFIQKLLTIKIVVLMLYHVSQPKHRKMLALSMTTPLTLKKSGKHTNRVYNNGNHWSWVSIELQSVLQIYKKSPESCYHTIVSKQHTWATLIVSKMWEKCYSNLQTLCENALKDNAYSVANQSCHHSWQLIKILQLLTNQILWKKIMWKYVSSICVINDPLSLRFEQTIG